jgi:hypothetical protein
MIHVCKKFQMLLILENCNLLRHIFAAGHLRDMQVEI